MSVPRRPRGLPSCRAIDGNTPLRRARRDRRRTGASVGGRAWVAMVVGSLATLMVASGSPAPSAGAAAKKSSGKVSASQCPLSTLARHKGTVSIDMWESMHTTLTKTLTALTNTFNSSQSKVHVNLVQQASYTDTWTKYQAGLTNGQLPDVVQLTSIDLQAMSDSRSALPVQACIEASHYKTSDFVAKILNAFKVGGAQVGMPFAISSPVLIYNQLAFQSAGISTPPATLDQMVSDAATLKAHGSGMALKLDPWHLETWLATANQLFVNNKNGRAGRATKTVFDNATSRKIWGDLSQLVKSGDAITTQAQGANPYDNLLALGSGQAAMTIDTSAVLSTVYTVLASGQYPNVKLGVAPLPVYSTKVKGGIEPGGSALYIPNRIPKLDQAAAWDFISFLDSATSQATWAAGTGYIPIRKSAAKSATVQSLWQQKPGFKVSYEQLVSGVVTPATAGAALGPYPQVRQVELTSEESMFHQGTSPAKALSSAASKINQILAQYNQRVGST